MRSRASVVAAALLCLVMLIACGRGTQQSFTSASAANQAGVPASPNPTPSPTSSLKEQAQQQSATVSVPAGTPITVRLQEALSSASAVPGQRFDAVLDEPIMLMQRFWHRWALRYPAM